jgi:hypothetical protein
MDTGCSIGKPEQAQDIQIKETVAALMLNNRIPKKNQRAGDKQPISALPPTGKEIKWFPIVLEMTGVEKWSGAGTI